MTEITIYEELLKLIAPKEITENFELKGIKEYKTSITIIFEEKEDRIPEELKGKTVVLDGFMNSLSLQTFPLKDKTVYMEIKRRRWKEQGTINSYYNHYDLHLKGMKTTREFGAFLKEELRLQPTEYNELWRGLTY
jgi:transposase